MQSEDTVKVSHIGVTFAASFKFTSENTHNSTQSNKIMWCEVCSRSVEWMMMKMLFTLLLTVLTATSGEGTHYGEGEGHLLRGGHV